MTDLLPCPFCNSIFLDVIDLSFDDPGFSVRCASCAACSGAYSTEAGAIGAWNTRALDERHATLRGMDEDALRQRVAELEAALAYVVNPPVVTFGPQDGEARDD